VLGSAIGAGHLAQRRWLAGLLLLFEVDNSFSGVSVWVVHLNIPRQEPSRQPRKERVMPYVNFGEENSGSIDLCDEDHCSDRRPC
jgi:hypothetical protein